MNALILRKATSLDSEFAYQTKKAAFQEYVEKVWGWNEQEQRLIHERRFASQDFYVIQVSDVDVGILALVHQPDCVRVNQLYILPERQNGGIGAACMMRVIEDAAIHSLPVRLQVLKVNHRAISFYQKLGFGSTGETATHVLLERLS
jgi:GNAT superfamily N-acetyltransferase